MVESTEFYNFVFDFISRLFEGVKPTTLICNSGMDDIDCIEIIMEVEDEYGLFIDISDMYEIPNFSYNITIDELIDELFQLAVISKIKS